MYKTPSKHKHTVQKRVTHYKHRIPKNDIDKIKAFLRETTQNLRDTAEDGLHRSYENVKETSGHVQHYLSERPIKSVSVSLVTGLLAGVAIGYFINNK